MLKKLENYAESDLSFKKIRTTPRGTKILDVICPHVYQVGWVPVSVDAHDHDSLKAHIGASPALDDVIRRAMELFDDQIPAIQHPEHIKLSLGPGTVMYTSPSETGDPEFHTNKSSLVAAIREGDQVRFALKIPKVSYTFYNPKVHLVIEQIEHAPASRFSPPTSD